MYQHFKFTPQVVRTGIVMMILVPGALTWLFADQEVRSLFSTNLLLYLYCLDEVGLDWQT